MNAPTLKQKLGCWLHERWRLEWALRHPTDDDRWLDLCNRGEVVERCADGVGRVCQWQDSSRLTVCRVFPRTGGRLLRKAWYRGPPLPVPPLSVVLPVRGMERAPSVQFVATALRRIAGQESEVLLCEHDTRAHYQAAAPEGCRVIFVPAAPGEEFNKSRAMNAGARAARHPVLVLLDSDMLPSGDCLARSAALLQQEWEAVRPLRFLFLLSEQASQAVLSGRPPDQLSVVAEVQQNFSGGSVVIRRDAYLAIGGHDERFAGWGGEDMEFLDRLQTRQLYPGSFSSAIHLWHPPAPQKQSGHRNHELMLRIMAEPVADRVARMRQLWGRGS